MFKTKQLIFAFILLTRQCVYSVWPTQIVLKPTKPGVSRPTPTSIMEEKHSTTYLNSTIKWSSIWNVLAPFPSGDFQADPLEAWGGVFEAIGNLPEAGSFWTYAIWMDSVGPYVSEMVDGGFIQWKPVDAIIDPRDNSVQLNINVNVSKTISSFFGQGGATWKGWAVGSFHVTGDGGLVNYRVEVQGPRFIYVDSDDLPITSDVYSNGLADFPVSLSPGWHSLYLPIGGSDDSYDCRIQMTRAKSLYLIEPDTLVPDLVDGKLSSPYLSVVVVNGATIRIQDAFIQLTLESDSRNFTAQIPSLFPGQPMPVRIDIPMDIGFSNRSCKNQIELSLRRGNPLDPMIIRTLKLSLRCRSLLDPFRFTFLDFDGSVQKAAARLPSALEECPQDSGCPVMVATHGASVEADSDAWTFAYPQQQHAWMLFPTNRRPFGYDWEGPGMMNTAFALKYLSESIPRNLYLIKARVDTFKRLFTGHSMGGHGCMLYSVLQPDYSIGSACASGWLRRDLYVNSFHYTSGMSRVDHQRSGTVQSMLDEFAVDILLENMVGSKVLLRMGTDDETVPSWGFRRLARMLNEYNGDQNLTLLSEVPGQGHWWDGIMNDNVMQMFYNKSIQNALQGTARSLPKTFRFSLLNPSSFSGKAGIQVLQLGRPFRLASIVVRRRSVGGGQNETWSLKTQNVRRFGFSRVQGMPFPSAGIRIDSQLFAGAPGYLPSTSFCRLDGTTWTICNDMNWTKSERHSLNYGPARLALQQAPIHIVYNAASSQHLREAIFLAQTLYYQGRYAPQLIPDTEFDPSGPSRTLIVLGSPSNNAAAAYIQNSTYQAVRFGGSIGRPFFEIVQQPISPDIAPTSIRFARADHGILFLTQWITASKQAETEGKQGLAIVIAGNSVGSFQTAVRRLFPLNSNVPMGDVAVMDRAKSWQGMASLIAFGVWTNEWQFDNDFGWIDASIL